MNNKILTAILNNAESLQELQIVQSQSDHLNTQV